MKHYFSSGEILYKENIRKIEEGEFVGDYMEYEDVEEETVFKCIGSLNNIDVLINFRVEDRYFDNIKFKYSIKILMQSDILRAKWKEYEIEYIV